MQNNLASFSDRAATLFFILLFALPTQADDMVKSENNTKVLNSPSAKFTNRKNITKINDLRIVVDISGSMKKTDPNNLRRSAVRLLAGLIPEGSRAGIWNFGKEVNMSVKIGTVNDAWRDLARAQSKKINSAGLFTNIEGVLRKASFDWKNPDPNYKRNIIILTDGHVDISKDEKLNEESRKRILKDVLPSFEKSKARIHTIALSDDVDESLLSTLSAYTDGLYKKAKSSDELQKIFLQMLQQSIKLDTLPIKDNRFSVDESINDMTLLVFNKDKSRPTVIVTPSNKEWNNDSHPDQVKWFSDEGYDLVTIKKPQKGEWKIRAPTDPNNRVVVATNLKLKLNEIPSYLILGDTLNISAHLEEDTKPLTDKALLSKFKFSLNRDAERSSERRYPLVKSDNDDYSYTVQLSPKFHEGINELVIQAISPTVKREIRHQFKVYVTPADITINDDNGKFKIKITPHQNILRPETIKISIELEDKSKHTLIQQGKDWLVDVDKKYEGTSFDVKIEAVGADGKPVLMAFSKILSVKGGIQKLNLAAKFESQQKNNAEHHAESKSEEKQNIDKKDAEHKNTDPKNQKPDHDANISNTADKNETNKKSSEPEQSDVEGKKKTSLTFIISSIVIGNLLLAGILGGGFIYMKRRKENLAKSLTDEMNADLRKEEDVKK